MTIKVTIASATGSAPDLTDWLTNGTVAAAPTTTLIKLAVIDPAITTIEIVGTGFTFNGSVLTGGTVTGFNFKHGTTVVGSATGFHLSGPILEAAIVAAQDPNDDPTALNALLFNSDSFTYTGGAGNDIFVGGDHNDTISSGAGNDTLSGGAGDDVIQGGVGADTLDGGDGNDIVSYAASTKAVTVDLNVQDGHTAQAGAAGSSDAAGDILSNFEGVTGSALADRLTANDAMGSTLSGGAGSDTLLGGSGDDTLIGGAGADTMDGGDGTSDTVSYAGSTLAVTIALGAGGAQTIGIGGDAAGDKISNIENITGGGGADKLTGNELDNILSGGGGDDTLIATAGNDTYDGGAGNDTVSYAGATFNTGVNVDLNVQDGSTAQSGGSPADGAILVSIENLIGSSGNDVLTGSGANNTINGALGDDIISGAGGNDTLDGGTSTALLPGGNDTVDYSYLTTGQNVTVTLGTLTATTGAVAQTTTSGVAGDIDKIANFENITGSDGNDVLTGNAGVNVISGMLGDDVIQGGAGTDTLDGGDGTNTVSYAASLKGVTTNLNVQDGTTPQPTQAVTNDASGDILSNFQNIIGSAQADTLTGDDNDNVLTGGAGNDTLIGNDGTDTLIGGAGADTMDGGDNTDTVSYAGSATSVVVTLGAGGAQTIGVGGDAAGDHISNIENITGGNGADTLTGNELDNNIQGGAGNDTILGGPGQDTLGGGTGTNTVSYVNDAAGVSVDLRVQDGVTPQSSAGSEADGDILSNFQNLTGGSGNDVLTGDSHNNVISGGAGDDTIDGGGGNDVLSGGANGSAGDTVSYGSASTAVTANLSLAAAQKTGGGGIDIVTGFENLTGGDFNDVLTGDKNNNVIAGGLGDDTIQGGAAADTLDGGGDNDTASYAASTKGVIVDLTLQGTYVNGDPAEGRSEDAQAQGGAGSDAQGDLLYGFANVTGSSQADTINGDDNDNVLTGNAGSDSLSGGAGNDTLIGGAGADTMDGGDGNNDTASYAGSTAAVTVTLGTLANPGIDDQTATTTGTAGDAQGDSIKNFENITGGNGNDTLTGNAADNVLQGGLGDDTLYGGGGNDVLDGGGGNDTVTYKAATAGINVDLSLQGVNVGPQSSPGSEADGNVFISIDNVTGSNFADDLTGNAGVNKIDGGAGDDTIDGGAGNDMLTGGVGNDTFVFKPGSGVDTVLGFAHGQDQIDLTAFGFSDFSQLSISGTTVNLGGGDKIIFTGLTGETKLSAADFSLPDATAPTARNDVLSTSEDSVTIITGTQLFSNDLNPQNDSLQITQVTDVVGGQAIVVSGGTAIQFTPDSGFSGKASFTYTELGASGSSSATATVNVLPVADTPTLTIGSGTATDATPQAVTNQFAVYANNPNVASSDPNGASIAALTGGGFVVTYRLDDGHLPNTFGSAVENVHASIFDANYTLTNNPILAMDLNNRSYDEPSVVGTPNNTFAVSMDGPVHGDVFSGMILSGYGSAGTPTSSQVVSSYNGDQSDSHLILLSDNSFADVWVSDGQDGNGFGIFGQHVNTNGTASGAVFQINTTAGPPNQFTPDGFQWEPDAAALAHGGFVAVWQSAEPDDSNDVIHYRIYNSDAGTNGNPVTAELSAANGNGFSDPVVAGLHNGGFVVSWQSTDFGNPGVFAQIYDDNGAAVGNTIEAPATQNIATNPSILALADGGFLLSWQDYTDTFSDHDIYAERFAADGTAIGSVFQINQDTTGDQHAGDGTLAQLANGDIVSIWTTQTDDTPSPGFKLPSEIWARVFSLPAGASGNQGVSGDEGSVITLPTIDAALSANDNTDGSESIKLILSGFADGTTFSEGALDTASGKWVISGAGEIAGLATTALTMTVPDFHGNFTLDVQAQVTDTALLTTGLTSDITAVTDQIDVTVNATAGTIAFTTKNAVSVVENTTGAMVVHADSVTPSSYSITGGADASLFTIDSISGALSFKTAPDFEAPADAGHDNNYDVTVTANNGTTTADQSIAVSVTNLNEAPLIDSNGGGTTGTGAAFATSIAENSVVVGTVHATDPESAAVKYSIVGGDDAAKFKVDANTGALVFTAAPNFEAPSDANKDNAYIVTVQASDGTLVDTQTITVNVTNKDELAPAISSNGGGATASISVVENAAVVTTVKATDADLGDTVTYSIVAGGDGALFSIDPNSGALTFTNPPDFENPSDSDHNNVYNVIVKATDSGATYDPGTGALSDTQALAVTVTNANEFAPAITGGDGPLTVKVTDGGSGILSSTALTTVVATDQDAGSKITYSILTGAGNGADGALFTVNSNTGVLAFKTAEHAATPLDSDKDNNYVVTVQASDGTLSDKQTITVSVFGADHAPTLDVSGGMATPLAQGGLPTVPTAVGSPMFFGGGGDQHGQDVVYSNGELYLAFNGSQSQTANDTGFVSEFDTNLTPVWTSSSASGNLFGLATDGNQIYAVGDSYALTNDGVGGKEVKTLVTNLQASDGSAMTNHGQPAFFSYSGVEFFQKDIVASNGFVYATGSGQPVSYDAYLLAKYDTSGNLIAAATDSSVGIGLPNGFGAPIPGSSGGFNLASDASNNIWVAGYSQWSTEGDQLAKPTIWEYDSNLTLAGRFKDTQETGLQGSYFADAVDNTSGAHALYAVGYTAAANGAVGSYSDLVSKFDTNTGQLVWTHRFGSAASEQLFDAVMVNGRLFAVGQAGVAGHGLDAMLFEIDPNTGNVLSTTTVMGGTGDDIARSITTDSSGNLYIAGETNTGGANGVDAFITEYSIGTGTSTPGFHFALPNTAIDDLDATGADANDILDLKISVKNGTVAAPPNQNLQLIKIDNDGSDGTLEVQGTLAQLNAGIANGIDYVMKNGFASDTLTLTVDDLNDVAGQHSQLIGGDKTVTQTFLITPTGLDAAPADIQLSNNSTAENSAAGTVIGTLTATDPDGPANEAFTFTLVAGGDSAPFKIDGNKLEVKSVLNFEAPADANHDNLYDFTIQVAETANPSVTFRENFEVQVTDVAEGTAETINGTASNDFITNSTDNSIVPAGYNLIKTVTDGSEIINGLAGNDTLKGWGGDDQLFGGGGNDILAGGAGNDLLNGGPVLFDGITAAGWGDINIANYSLAQSPITADLKAGTVDGVGAGHDTLVNIEGIIGTQLDDTLSGGSAAFVESFQGGGGNDVINGRGGLDQAVYSDASGGGINVDLKNGIVDGTAGGLGVDTLRSVEWIVGSSHNDTYDASDFGPFGANQGNFVNGYVNFFTPGGGNDTVKGNGATILDYSDVQAGFTADLGAPTITTGAGVTTVTGGVMGVVGGAGNDTLIGTDNYVNLNSDTVSFELFVGGLGNDTINGKGGIDFAVYDYFAGALSAGISVNLGTGIVTGLDVNTQALIGTDTLRNIEGVWGTDLNDILDASTFTGIDAANPSANAGDGTKVFGSSNESAANVFDPGPGNDTITGNGLTEISYFSATGGITATFSATTTGTGTITGNASVGTDTFTKVFAVDGTPFADKLTGGAGTQDLEGNGGNDILVGGAGNDFLRNGTVDYSSAAAGVYVNLDVASHSYIDTKNVTVNIQGQTAQSIDTDHNAHPDLANIGVDQLGEINGVIGSSHNDIITGGSEDGANVQIFRGGAGDDIITGVQSLGGQGSSFQMSDYSDATGGVTVVLSNVGGTLHSITASGAGVGNDTLTNINEIRGSNFNDTYDSTAISQSNNGQDFNQFEGLDGNDTINVGPNTWISYQHAAAGVVVNTSEASYAYIGGTGSIATNVTVSSLTATSTGASNAAKIGTDTIVVGANDFVGETIGSNFDDILIGANGSGNNFFGGSGNDFIDGNGGGGDQAEYFVPIESDLHDGYLMVGVGADQIAVPWGNVHGMTINLAAGQVIGDPTIYGTDTLRNIDRIVGSSLDDIYNASGFGGPDAANEVTGIVGTLFIDGMPVNASWNEFAGGAGNDTIIGNGNTTISYDIASVGISVDLAAGTADDIGTTQFGASNGHDIIAGGVNAVNGTSNDDFFRGTAAAERFEGGGGIDTIVYENATNAVTVNLQTFSASGGGGNDFLDNIENVGGSNFNDVLTASNSNTAGAVETFYGGAGNDTINGGTGYDRASYNLGYYKMGTDGALTGSDGIVVDLGAGTVTGDATEKAAQGWDTLTGIESVFGTAANDVFNASDFTGAGAASPSPNHGGSHDAANDFQGFGGNDTLQGNGSTQVDYFSAQNAVVVNLDETNSHSFTYSNGVIGHYDDAQGATTIFTSTATDLGSPGGDGGVGTDTFVGADAGNVAHGINSIIGSDFNDLLIGSSGNGSATTESFTGAAGNDLIIGNGGFDRASYDFVGETSVTVDLGAGTAVANDGTDTLRSIESIQGTSGNDSYDASGFTTTSTNAGDAGVNTSGVAFNEFIGMGGNDTITGNGNTRVDYEFASGAVQVTFDLTTSGVGHSSGADGNDTFLGGVTTVKGSNFNDTIVGGAGAQRIQGGLGADTLAGNAGNDQFEYSSPNEGGETSSNTSTGDVITDFTSGQDHFRINVFGFSGLVSGENGIDSFGGQSLKSDYFVSGPTDTLTHDGFFFDTSHGNDGILFWDPDGTHNNNVVIAHLGLTTSHTVLASDFDLR